MKRIHATAVAKDGQAVLLSGPSGAGKSDLALRLMDRGWALVSDDYTALKIKDGALTALAPEHMPGILEVRGAGLIRFDEIVPEAPVAGLFDLVNLGDVERLPQPEFRTLLGQDVPLYRLVAHEPSAPVKVEAILSALVDGRFENDRSVP